MPLDEASSAFWASASQAPRIHSMSPVEAREAGAARRAQYGPGPDMARVEDIRIPSVAGGVPVRILVPHSGPNGGPQTGPRGVIVYYHGGGWVLGSVAGTDALGRTIADRTGCVVVLVDYRLAPEHRFPAGVEDSWVALRWVAERAGDLTGSATAGAEPLPLIVAGDSAGGNLAAVMAQRAHAAGGPGLSAQVMVCPVTDCDLDRPSYLDPANQLMLSRDSMVWFFDHYVPDAAARTNPEISPLRADDLTGLPPAIVMTAEYDVLVDEAEVYVEQLRSAGVPVQYEKFAGQMHGFFTMVNLLPGHAAGIDYLTDALDRHLVRPSALPA